MSQHVGFGWFWEPNLKLRIISLFFYDAKTMMQFLYLIGIQKCIVINWGKETYWVEKTAGFERSPRTRPGNLKQLWYFRRNQNSEIMSVHVSSLFCQQIVNKANLAYKIVFNLNMNLRTRLKVTQYGLSILGLGNALLFTLLEQLVEHRQVPEERCRGI